MVGLCKEDENPFGPVHEKVVPMSVVPLRVKVDPVQTGLLLDADAVGAVQGVNSSAPISGVETFRTAQSISVVTETGVPVLFNGALPPPDARCKSVGEAKVGEAF